MNELEKGFMPLPEPENQDTERGNFRGEITQALRKPNYADQFVQLLESKLDIVIASLIEGTPEEQSLENMMDEVHQIVHSGKSKQRLSDLEDIYNGFQEIFRHIENNPNLINKSALPEDERANPLEYIRSIIEDVRKKHEELIDYKPST